MPANDNSHPVNVDARKLALEAMATLVNVKRIAADLLRENSRPPQNRRPNMRPSGNRYINFISDDPYHYRNDRER